MRSNLGRLLRLPFSQWRSDEDCRESFSRQRTDKSLGRCLTVILPENSVRGTHWDR
jgi:hypothetical protein